MENYDVVTNDDAKVGHVVGTEGDFVVVEHGLIRKQKHAVPRQLANVDEGEQVVRLTVSKEVFEEGPKIEDGEINRQQVAQYYGLADAQETPDTQGYGDVVPGDPARTAEQDAHRFGVESAPEERARVRDSMRPEGEQPSGPQLGSTGIHQDRWEVKE